MITKTSQASRMQEVKNVFNRFPLLYSIASICFCSEFFFRYNWKSLMQAYNYPICAPKTSEELRQHSTLSAF